jgi:hypothetical protein
LIGNAKHPSGLGAAKAALYFYTGQYVLKTREKETGGERVSYLSPADVRAAFTAERLDTGWIPETIVRCGSTAAGPFAVAYFPASRHTIGLLAEDGSLEPMTVPIPPLVLFGRGSYYVWAVTTPAFDPKGRLFHAPFPNVFADGRICYGSNKPPRSSYTALSDARDLFLNTPFNGNEAEHRSKAHPEDVRLGLRELAASRAKVYPHGDLIPTSAGRTVASAVERLLG